MKFIFKRKRIFWVSVLLILFIAVWNYPCHYKIGIEGRLFIKTIPFYAKMCGFFYRDWAYREIVKEITRSGRSSDVDKVMDVFQWTRENIINKIPEGLKPVDDHPLNIIIRQYGSGDQLEDVFTILCSYSGIKAGMVKCYDHANTNRKILSVVFVDGRWLIFSVSRNKYFMNKDGGIASIDDYRDNNIVLSGEDKMEYGEYLDYLKDLDLRFLTRADEQMPLRRIPAEIKKAFIKGEADS